MTRTLAAVVFALAVAHTTRGDDPPKAKSPAEALQGAWLFDEAALKKRSELGRVWESVLTVKGDSFALSKLMGAKGDLKSTLVFDPKDPTAVDLKFAELDLSELLEGYKFPAGTLPGRYKLDGDRLTLCLPTKYDGKRPEKFEANGEQYLATLVRAPKDYKGPPKEVKVTVVGPDGKPAAGAIICQHMTHREDPKTKKPAEWVYHDSLTCDANGTITMSTEKMYGAPLIALNAAKDAMGIATTSPAKLASGAFRIELRQQVKVTGTMTCDELTKAGQELGWTGGYLLHNGTPVAFYTSKAGKFEFLAPPGKYTLNMYGEAIDTKFVDIVVPQNRSEYTVEPIAMPPLAFSLLKGKPAPEFVEVTGWKGAKVKLADLKGKYVLLEFWGYWCGPCVGSMPVLIELHEKYADKGLAIVGVHMDIDGEVDSAEKLDAKLVSVKKELWKGKDMPFPSALVAGTRVGDGDDKRPGGTVALYGVRSWPTTILIDPEGKVVGRFGARDIQKASEEIEKLLAGKK